MSIVYLPYRFTPYPYQKTVFKAFFKDKIKRLICIWHRRAGKDLSLINLCIIAAHQRVGTYYYLFPQLGQARRNIWQGMDEEGIGFMDRFPARLIRKINHSEMRIQFKNGSVFQLVGCDYYNKLMGANPIGIIFSEYSLQNPAAWTHLSPILVKNGGWAIFNYTPRGMNHAFDLYDINKDNPKWFTQVLTVDDTKDNNNNPIISSDQIDEERKSGKSEDFLQQEYYCSFSASVHGAYFSKQLAKCDKENRILNFPIDTSFLVNTYWDIGRTDSTAIWFIQYSNGKYYVIDYYENNNEDIPHFINYIHDFRSTHGIVYGKHFAPHDFGNKSFGYGTGETLHQSCLKLGVRFEPPVPRVPDKIDAIHAVKSVFEKLIIHKDNCHHGLACLREYHAKYNESKNTYGDPEHNWASHGADALMTFAQSLDMFKNKHERGVILKNRVRF